MLNMIYLIFVMGTMLGFELFIPEAVEFQAGFIEINKETNFEVIGFTLLQLH